MKYLPEEPTPELDSLFERMMSYGYCDADPWAPEPTEKKFNNPPKSRSVKVTNEKKESCDKDCQPKSQGMTLTKKVSHVGDVSNYELTITFDSMTDIESLFSHILNDSDCLQPKLPLLEDATANVEKLIYWVNCLYAEIPNKAENYALFREIEVSGVLSINKEQILGAN